MKYAVFGPRAMADGAIYDNERHVDDCLSSLSDIEMIYFGGSRGVEQLAGDWARNKGIPYKKIPPNLQSLPFDRDTDAYAQAAAQAFDTRNVELLAQADAVIIFWDGIFRKMIPIMQRAIAMRRKVILFPM